MNIEQISGLSALGVTLSIILGFIGFMLFLDYSIKSGLILILVGVIVIICLDSHTRYLIYEDAKS